MKFKLNDFAGAKEVRERVFMQEQGFKNEFDEIDSDRRCIHICAYENDSLVGCSRIFPSEMEPNTDTIKGKWVFGRLAVLPEYRKGGRGSEILAESERAAKNAGATEIHLHAQCSAMPFYERSGYAAYGPVEFDEHVEHRWMSKKL
ncbi:GNAT family N-acetyltransferase [Adlercreutzia sp. ZJ304]|uniref:GNAT family N-acetyltransferase n=1 Tax=Adlercreutzia sp. ZJ304 TaxID=2709791 RepID=UPI0013ED628F|nr:GNAT family N-acetyltransferase [Adlercreutzia sp. ZJ304]